MNPLIYSVEDDEAIRELITYVLESDGYRVTLFTDIEALYRGLEKEHPSLILLDIMLPQVDGLTILGKLKSGKETNQIPVIILSAKTSELDKVKGLDLGADDYISKPFSVLEFSARIRAVLRKSKQPVIPSKTQYSLRGLTLNHESHEVYLSGNLVKMTLKEYNLLKLLFENQGNVIERDTLISNVWGYEYMGESRTLDMHVKQIRQKLKDAGDETGYIETIRGVGYKLV